MKSGVKLNKRLLLLLAILVIVLTTASIAYAYFYVVLPYPWVMFNGIASPKILLSTEYPNLICVIYHNVGVYKTRDSVDDVVFWFSQRGWYQRPVAPKFEFQSLGKDFSLLDISIITISGGAVRDIGEDKSGLTFISLLDSARVCYYP